MNNLQQRVLTSIFLVIIFLCTFFLLPIASFSLLLLVILAHILIVEWPVLCATKLMWLLTPLYPIAPFGILLYLNNCHHHLLLILFSTVAMFDTGSYIFGNTLGAHKILPTVSPGKTWEGALGGYTFASIFFYLFFGRTFIHVLIASFIVCALALIGDLFESWLKRRAGIKDTAAILPGHGGFLDRFDGIMIAGIGIYFLRNWV